MTSLLTSAAKIASNPASSDSRAIVCTSLALQPTPGITASPSRSAMLPSFATSRRWAQANDDTAGGESDAGRRGMSTGRRPPLLVDLPLASGPVRLAQLELLQLARGRARERVAELDRRRTLVVRHARPTERDQVVRARRRPRPQHDQRLDRLAPFLVGDADHRGLGHGRMLIEAVLHLDRGDVLAAGDDHVLLPVGDHDVGIFGVAAVAGVEPAVRQRLGGLLGLVPVALEDVVGPREDLAVLVDGHAHADRRHARARQTAGPFALLD